MSYTIETSRFGTLSVDEDKVFVFPEGILGFSKYTKYTFIQEEGCEPFKIMQSLEDPELAYVIVDPLSIKTDYDIEIMEEELEVIESDSIEDLVVYAIVTMGKTLATTTMNLQGPLIINPKKRLCQQYVIYDDKYSTKEPFITKKTASAKGEKEAAL